MTDEPHGLLKTLQDNYGWVAAACAGLSFASGWVRKKAWAAWAVITRTSTSIALERLAKLVDGLLLQAMISTAVARLALNENMTPRWETDAKGQCVWVNEASCRLFGLPREEMLGTRWTQAIEAGHAPRVMEAFMRAYESDDYVYHESYSIIVKGKRIHLSARAVETIRDEDGIVLAMFGTLTPENLPI
jgi:PAS domain S-box-containing protein